MCPTTHTLSLCCCCQGKLVNSSQAQNSRKLHQLQPQKKKGILTVEVAKSLSPNTKFCSPMNSYNPSVKGFSSPSFLHPKSPKISHLIWLCGFGGPEKGPDTGLSHCGSLETSSKHCAVCSVLCVVCNVYCAVCSVQC